MDKDKMFEKLINKKILVVDDNEEIVEIIELYAKEINVSVKGITNSLTVIDELKKNKYDIIILDVSMPGIDGFELFEGIKKNFNIPILFLSAKVHETDKVRGLLLGAEDYITKPFSLKELFLKIQIILERNENYLYVNQGFEFDLVRHKLFYKEVEVRLTQKAFLLLLYLVKNENRIISREDILKEIWEQDVYLDDRTVDSHIKEIRKKVGKDIVKTRRGQGYMYENNKA